MHRMTSSKTDNSIIHKINFTDQQAHTDIDKVLNKIKFDQFQLLLALKIVGTCVTLSYPFILIMK